MCSQLQEIQALAIHLKHIERTSQWDAFKKGVVKAMRIGQEENEEQKNKSLALFFKRKLRIQIHLFNFQQSFKKSTEG